MLQPSLNDVLEIDGTRYRPVDWQNIDGWSNDDHSAAYSAFLSSAQRMTVKPYRQGTGPVNGNALRKTAELAVQQGPLSKSTARKFFENHFVPHLIEPSIGEGFVTGFFEPVVAASRAKTEQFPIPLMRRPADLIDIDDNNRPDSMDPQYRFGRVEKGEIKPYFDRPAIQAGELDGRGLELAWVRDKTAAFFIHVQGSARLTFEHGPDMRITYAAKSGHPYTSLAKVLCAQKNIAPETMTSDRLAEWMRSHPQEIDALLAHNKSYIFFREEKGNSADEGPIAAAKIPLIAGRSMAVDRLIHTFGTPFWVRTKIPLPEHEDEFAQLMIAHDTGSAIVGSARGDLFMGSGDDAGLIAGRIRHEATLTILVPKE